jgi:hypothetical protein
VAIVYRATKGSNLTPAEVDGNFHDVDDRLIDLETAPPGITFPSLISTDGTNLTISYAADGGPVFDDLALPIASPSFTPVPIGEITVATFTLIINTMNRFIECTHVDGCAITFPTNDDVGFPVGTEITFVAFPGPLSFIPATGVTFNWLAGHDLATERDGAVVTAKQMVVDRWRFMGSLKVSP